jgi:hypothetical protein
LLYIATPLALCVGSPGPLSLDGYLNARLASLIGRAAQMATIPETATSKTTLVSRAVSDAPGRAS